MIILHTRAVRNAAANELVTLNVGHTGRRLVFAACKDETTGYTTIPMYIIPLGCQFKTLIGPTLNGVDPADVCPLVPAAGQVQGSIYEWMGWYGSLPLDREALAVGFDVSLCILGDVIECLAGVE